MIDNVFNNVNDNSMFAGTRFKTNVKKSDKFRHILEGTETEKIIF